VVSVAVAAEMVAEATVAAIAAEATAAVIAKGRANTLECLLLLRKRHSPTG
jgi:hypothetical protein